MSKRLVIEGKYIPEKDAVQVTVIGQTHRKDLFGNQVGYQEASISSAFRATSGLILDSANFPMWNEEEFVLFVRGEYLHHDYSPSYTLVSLPHWWLVAEAVEEYNEYFKD